MATTFEKQKFNSNFDHEEAIVDIMNRMGYGKVKVVTSLANGLSHYVTLTVDVLNEGKCWADMFVYDGQTSITIRISDHASGLEKNCGGVCGNKMTMDAFKRLIEAGAIKSIN